MSLYEAVYISLRNMVRKPRPWKSASGALLQFWSTPQLGMSKFLGETYAYRETYNRWEKHN